MEQVTNAAYGLLRKRHLSFFLLSFYFSSSPFPSSSFFYFFLPLPELFLIFHFSLPSPLPESFLFLIFPFLFSVAHQAKASHFYYHFSFHCFLSSPHYKYWINTHIHTSFWGREKSFYKIFIIFAHACYCYAPSKVWAESNIYALISINNIV